MKFRLWAFEEMIYPEDMKPLGAKGNDDEYYIGLDGRVISSYFYGGKGLLPVNVHVIYEKRDVKIMRYLGWGAYEGDIIKLLFERSGYVHYVKINDESWEDYGCNELCRLLDEWSDWGHNIEVLGNIYENPELIEKYGLEDEDSVRLKIK